MYRKSRCLIAIAVIGLNGVISYTVQRRSREIGVRIALGAESSHVRNLILSQGMRITLLAVTIGIFGAFTLTGFMTRFLFGVSARVAIVQPAALTRSTICRISGTPNAK